MKKKQLVPFSIAGRLDYCPECGATGDYALLKARAKKVRVAFRKYVMAELPGGVHELGKAIDALYDAIDKEEKK